MADALLIATLRANIGDSGTPPAWADGELGDLLDAAAGSEPRARVAALLPLWAEAAGRTDYTVGVSSEKTSQAFDQLHSMLTRAQGEVAALDGAVLTTARETAQATVAVPLAWVF